MITVNPSMREKKNLVQLKVNQSNGIYLNFGAYTVSYRYL